MSNEMQRYTVYFIWKLLFMFRVVPPPIIRSANNCIYSIWYLSDRYCYLPLSWQVAVCVAKIIWNQKIFRCLSGTHTAYFATVSVRSLHRTKWQAAHLRPLICNTILYCYSVVSAVIRLRYGKPRNRVYISAMGKESLSYPNGPDRLPVVLSFHI